MKKGFFKLFVSIACLLLALTLNFRHALNNYGVADSSNVHVLAQTGTTNGSGDGGYGGAGGTPITNYDGPCTTHSKEPVDKGWVVVNGKNVYEVVVTIICIGSSGTCEAGTISSHTDICANTTTTPDLNETPCN